MMLRRVASRRLLLRAVPASRQLLAARPAVATARWSSSSSKDGTDKADSAKSEKIDPEKPDSSKGEDGDASEKKEGGSSDEPPIPLHQRLVGDISKLFGFVKNTVVSARNAADSAAAAARQPGPVDGPGEGDPSAGAVVVRPPSFWEKFSNQESPLFNRLRGMMDGAGGSVGDFFGETEQAEALALLREQRPDFKQEAFLEHIYDDLGPQVIAAYLKGDLDVLREHTRDQAFAILNSSVQERITRQVRMDERILHFSEPELESIKIINGLPTVIVSFETHQLYCIRNAMGKVEEGDEDDIRAFHYLWALQVRTSAHTHTSPTPPDPSAHWTACDSLRARFALVGLPAQRAVGRRGAVAGDRAGYSGCAADILMSGVHAGTGWAGGGLRGVAVPRVRGWC